MSESPSPLQQTLATLARAALVLALAAAGWTVHRQLPDDGPAGFGGRGRGETTTLRLVLRRPPDYPATDRQKVPVHLYSINVEAARNEYVSERRPGVRFEEFVTRRMGGREPVAAEFDERGEAVVVVPQGRWWIHATLDGPEELTWRLPVNVSGREKTIELGIDNAYTRAKSF